MKWENAKFSNFSEVCKFLVECERYGVKVGIFFPVGSGRNEIWVVPYKPIGDKQKSQAIRAIENIIWQK